MGKQSKQWLAKPEKHDYPAAISYLSLIYDAKTAARFAKALAKAPMTSFKAKDIFRASRLPLLGTTNSHVRKNQKKLAGGKNADSFCVRAGQVWQQPFAGQ